MNNNSKIGKFLYFAFSSSSSQRATTYSIKIFCRKSLQERYRFSGVLLHTSLRPPSPAALCSYCSCCRHFRRTCMLVFVCMKPAHWPLLLKGGLPTGLSRGLSRGI